MNFAFMNKLFTPALKKMAEWWKKPPSFSKRGSRGFVVATGFYNKSAFRISVIESRRKLLNKVEPTGEAFADCKGRGYRVFSDGSYRRMAATGRKLIPV